MQYVSWLKDPKINAFLESRHETHTLSSVTEFVESVDKRADAILFGLFLRDTGEHIGNVKISDIEFNHGHAEIGYLIGNHEVWGKGYATEAIVAVSAFSFSILKLTKLTAGAYSQNTGSIRVLEKSGFQRFETQVISGGEANSQDIEVFRFALFKPK